MADWYLPGFKAGGPVRTLSNLVDRLSSQFRFTVVTRDRDIGDSSAYPVALPGQPVSIGHAAVHYLPPSASLPLETVRRLARMQYDLLYCNSMFSPAFSIAPAWARWLRLLPRTPLVLAPRGELGPAAMAGSAVRKRLLLHAARLLGVYRDVLWHATDEAEAAQIRSRFGVRARIVVVPNMGGAMADAASPAEAKRRDELRLLFVGRVSRMKNLLGALEILKLHPGPATYDIYGPIEDHAYFARCQEAVADLPPNVRVTFHGPIAHEHIASLMSRYDLLFNPTLGENFGHVIVEALAAGLPVLISDRTPWRGLEEQNAGWDLPLEDPAAFNRVLAACAEMDDAAFSRLRLGARTIGQAAVTDADLPRRSAELFRLALADAWAPPTDHGVASAVSPARR